MLRNILKKTDLKRNLLIATSGTAIAQSIHILTTPILTRIYTPEAFGQFSIFLSIIGLLTSFSTLKYDLAILIAKDEEIKSIDKLIKSISLVVAILILLISIILFTYGSTKYSIIFAISSLGSFVSARFWSTRAISNKLGLFRDLSIGKVFENSLNATLGIGIGLVKPLGAVLMFSKITGLFASYSYLKFKNKPHLDTYEMVNIQQVKGKYIQFPKYSFIADLTSTLNLSLIIFIFTSLFGEDNAGHIGLSTRVLSVPINFISISFLDVFRHRAIEDYKRTGRFDLIFKKFFFLLSAIAIPVILVLHFFAPYLFELIFSNNWTQAGIYSQYLVFLYAIRLISSPLSYSFSINNKLKINLFYQIIFVFAGLISIFVGYFLYKTDIACIIFYSATMFLLNGAYLYSAYLNSKPQKGNRS